MQLRILIDTNIFIPLEDSPILSDTLAELDRIHRENNAQLLIHPCAIEDIERDKDEERKQRCLSRLNKYPQLESPPNCSAELRDSYQIDATNANDRVDNKLLEAVFGDAVSFLITEDIGIHRKAKRLGINERVFYVVEAVAYLKRFFGVQGIDLPNVQEISVHQIIQYIDSPFFDSLREDYGQERFNVWLRDAARSGRKAWFCEDDNGSIGAICIYKDEFDELKLGLSGKILKLCCFKVGDSVKGRKIGELFLKAAFRYATNNGHQSIYITMFSGKQEHLVELCEDFGFNFHVQKDDGEDVYVKQHPSSPPHSDLPPLEYHKQYAPHFKYGSNIGKFLIPIQSQYHTKLFPDCYIEQGIQQTLFTLVPIGEGLPGNALMQAYLCHSNTTQLKAGDILLFYRSHDTKEITTIGVVEEATHFTDSTRVMERVTKRTVYNREEIESMTQKPCLTILFRLVSHLGQPLSASIFKEIGINGPIQSIRSLKEETFQEIIRRAGIQNCLYAN